MNDSHSVKKQSAKDWHKADIKAALEKKGWSLSRLAKKYGYQSRTTLNRSFDPGGWPKGERIIAHTIGVDPSVIWPSRYQNSTKARQIRNVKPCRQH